MKLLSDSQFDIKDYYGDIVIMYPDAAKATANELAAKLDVAGYVYHLCALGAASLTNRNYVNETVSLLNGSSCFVPIFTSDLMEKESNSVFRAVMWYFIGYVKANKNGAIVPFIESKEKISLAGTPIQQLDIMKTSEAFIDTITTKFSTKLYRNNYYKNRTTNLYASKRILYHCLRLSFNIYEASFKNAKKLYQEYTSRRMNDSQFDEYIEKNLFCGCKILSFGSDERLEPQMMVYKEEIHPDTEELQKTLIGKKVYRKLTEEEIELNPENEGIRAELMMDILVPVHKLLGAYVKAYLKCNDADCPIQLVLALMEPDFTGREASDFEDLDFESNDFWLSLYPAETFIDDKLDRLYFALNFEKPDNPITPHPSQRIGDSIDYIFPQ